VKNIHKILNLLTVSKFNMEITHRQIKFILKTKDYLLKIMMID